MSTCIWARSTPTTASTRATGALAWLPAGRYYVVADRGFPRAAVSLTASTPSRWDTPRRPPAGSSTTFVDIALHAFDIAWGAGDTESFVYTMVDFSLHSSLEREWIVDLTTGDLMWHLHTTHGEASANSRDPGYADSFSNIPESHQSSLGMMKAGETYTGSYGYSMRLDGLEAGYNDNVRTRAIVVHPWEYASASTAAEYGMVGLSWGCPAIGERVSRRVIDATANGSLYFFY